MTDPDLPVTEEEYERMKEEAAKYGLGDLRRLQREDRAFLIYEITKYEMIHAKPLTFKQRFRSQEIAWWHRMYQ